MLQKLMQIPHMMVAMVIMMGDIDDVNNGGMIITVKYFKLYIPYHLGLKQNRRCHHSPKL